MSSVFQRIRAEFDEFEKLFGRYLQEAGHAIMWDKIRLVSEDLVRILITIPDYRMYIMNTVDLDFSKLSNSDALWFAR